MTRIKDRLKAKLSKSKVVTEDIFNNKKMDEVIELLYNDPTLFDEAIKNVSTNDNIAWKHILVSAEGESLKNALAKVVENLRGDLLGTAFLNKNLTMEGFDYILDSVAEIKKINSMSDALPKNIDIKWMPKLSLFLMKHDAVNGLTLEDNIPLYTYMLYYEYFKPPAFGSSSELYLFDKVLGYFSIWCRTVSTLEVFVVSTMLLCVVNRLSESGQDEGFNFGYYINKLKFSRLTIR